MTILVTGGAGYIGSFMTRRLLDEGYTVVVIDSLERGNKNVIDERAIFEQGNLLDTTFIKNVFSTYEIGAVIHFAAYISMAESMEDPGVYFLNNIDASRVLLQQIKTSPVPFILSSTAGVYGNPIRVPIDEDHPKSPTNPYGESKLIVETFLKWYHQIFNIPYAALRYFNAAGASTDGRYGENHYPESHIIPNIIKAGLNNTPFIMYGDNYETEDGTAVRDYIHVYDLVEAHLLALKKLLQEKVGLIYNIGTGNGYSNRTVYEMVREVSQLPIELKIADRRPGDASVLVADSSKIKNELGFSPKYSDLKTIVETAWKFHSQNSSAAHER